jgi:thiamine-phosphate pyrophosphorylase
VQSLADLATGLKRRAQRRAGANRKSLRLPACILIVDSARLSDPAAAIARLPRGSMVILRDYAAADRTARARRLATLCRRHNVRLLVGADARLALQINAAGLHLPEWAIARGDRRWRLWRRPAWLVTAAAHSPAAIARARRAGADVVLVSPVFATASHPDAKPLGPLRFAAWTRRGRLPVYALGGMTPATARRLSASGAVGVAAVSAFTAPADQSSQA